MIVIQYHKICLITQSLNLKYSEGLLLDENKSLYSGKSNSFIIYYKKS